MTVPDDAPVIGPETLPATTPTSVPIGSWQVNLGNGQTITVAPGGSVVNPYPDQPATGKI